MRGGMTRSSFTRRFLMRPHISLDVRDVSKSVVFYEKVFGVPPQKQVTDYAKFDLKTPALNFSLVSSTGEVSAADHMGVEVETVEEIAEWKARLQQEGILEKVEDNIACCFARQDKLWFTDPCSAPLKSSHLSYLLRPILDRASIAQRLMRALFVVPPQPVPNDPPRLLERLKPMLPDTFLFETPKEPFNDPILFRRIRRDELLLQPIVSTGLSKSPTLDDQPIVAAEDRCALRTQGPKSLQTRRFDRPFRLLCPTAQGELIAHHFPIMTINDRRQMRPTIVSTINMRHIHGPAFVAAIRPTRPALHARAWGGDALMHEPPVLLQHTIDGLPIDEKSVPESQQHPQPPIPKRWILLE